MIDSMGHKLDELFLQLDDSWKNCIIKQIGYENTIFYYFLHQSLDAFERWRYIYKKEDKERRIYFVFKKTTVILQKVAYGKFY